MIYSFVDTLEACEQICHKCPLKDEVENYKEDIDNICNICNICKDNVVEKTDSERANITMWENTQK